MVKITLNVFFVQRGHGINTVREQHTLILYRSDVSLSSPVH